MKVQEIQAKSIIAPSKIPSCDYAINPYTGCQHSCVYCYADYMGFYSGHTEPWGQFVDVKINGAELIDDCQKYRGKEIMFSSVTDAYQPVEKKYQLTRRILEKLIPCQPKITILTKSPLVTRDIDILKQFEDVKVGFSLITINPEYQKQLDPGAASPSERLEALAQLKAAGINTSIFVAPILPYFTRVEEIIKAGKNCADYFLFDAFNRKSSKKVLSFIAKSYPQWLPKYEYALRDGNYKEYKSKLKKHIDKLMIDYKIKGRILFS
ncbi:MAG: radical SAM protein [Parcubacteria group bacterium]|nr:radical SAM protein [Parcubacteria group bacterium]